MKLDEMEAAMTTNWFAGFSVFCLALLAGCSELVFVRGRDSATPQIYKMRADGSQEEDLSRTLFNSSYPDASPDGRKIAFSSGNIEGGAAVNIYLMPLF